jgi:hypothetical protein
MPGRKEETVALEKTQDTLLKAKKAPFDQPPVTKEGKIFKAESISLDTAKVRQECNEDLV